MDFMKRALLPFCLLLFVPFSVFSRTNINFHASPALEIVAGKIDESVYSSGGKKISLLEWKQLPLCGISLSAGFCVSDFSFDAAFSYSLPLVSGSFEDSDWNLDGIKTCYSVHEERSVLNFSASVCMKYDFRLSSVFSFYPLVRSSFYYDSFSARNGSGRYGITSSTGLKNDVSWESPYAKFYARLYGIDFSSQAFYTFTGIGFSAKPFARFSVSVDFSISPFVYSHFVDHHLDSFSSSDGGFSIRAVQKDFFKHFFARAEFLYSLTERFDFVVGMEYLFGSEIKGETCFYEGFAKDYFSPSGQEAGHKAMRFDFSAGLRFSGSFIAGKKFCKAL